MRAAVCVGLVWLAVEAGQGRGVEIIYDKYSAPTPVGTWSYSFAVGVGKGNDPSYVPTLSNMGGLAVSPGGGPSNPAAGWIHQDPAHHDEDTIRAFRTYLLSPTDLSGGDDGHSIYVNGTFVGGGGFGVAVNTTINLVAGVATEVDLLGYNGPGPWQLVWPTRPAWR